MKKNSNVIILGGAGYIGTEVSNFFIKKKYKVKAIDNLIYNQPKPKKQKNFLFQKLDIDKVDKIEKLISQDDIVIILAGLVGDPVTKKYPVVSKKINENSIINVIKLCIKKKIEHLVFVSTCSNYGVVKNNEVVNEKSKLNPISLYAKSKVKIEKYLQKNKKSKTKITILRFATAFGLSSRMRFDLTINEFVREIFLKNSLEVYESETWRPYCHVKDFALAIFKVIKTKRSKTLEIYNVGSNKNNYTKKMIVQKIGKFLDINNVKYVDKQKDFRNYRVNFSKIKKNLRLSLKYSVEYGIKEIIHSMKKNNFRDLNKVKDNYGNYKIKKIN
jgi:nucleoside-diphosphate-sugar epimerase